MNKQHLTELEIERFASAESGEASAPLSDVQVHFAECSQCAALVNAYRRANEELQSLKYLAHVTENGPCPSGEQWLMLAAGLIEEKAALQLLAHASQCSECARQFKLSQVCLKENKAELPALESSTPEWQRRVAGQMAAGPSPPFEMPKKAPLRWKIFSLAAAAAVLIVAGGLVLRKLTKPADIEHLLAKAYSQDRTLEMRFPGASYSALRLRRAGSQESLTTTDDPLEVPKKAIRSLCKKTPGSKECTVVRAQLDVLDWRYQPALAALATLRDGTESREVLLTRALAEYEKGEIEGESRIYASSYGQAIEDLSKILRMAPHDPVALFNRALVYEKLSARENAIADWQELLRSENDPGWAAEANRRLDALRERKKNRTSDLKSLYDPDQAYQALARSAAVDPLHSEAFLQDAVEYWLPPSIVSFSPGPVALKKLAQALKDNHGDLWLMDFLGARSAPAAVSLLRSAISANSSGNPDHAARAAGLAEKLFSRAGNFPGVVRSRFELVYALHRQFNAAGCIRQGEALHSAIGTRSYSWLLAHIPIEISGCYAMLGHFDRSRRLVNDGLKDSKRFGYANLHLRAVSFDSALQRTEGMLNRAWLNIDNGLTMFWSAPYPSERGHQFYGDLEFAAEENGEFHLAEAFQREALVLTEESKRHDILAYDHFRLGAAAEIAGDHEIARQELEIAHDLFQQLSGNMAGRMYESDAEIALAQLEASQGSIQPALQRLERAGPQVARIQRLNTRLSYWMARAAVERQLGNPNQERQYLEQAVSAGNQGFKGLHSNASLWGWRREVGPVYRRLFEIEIHAPHDAAQALADWESFHGVVRPGPVGPPIFNVEAKERLLKKVSRLGNAALVVFATLEDGVHVWVAGERGIDEFQINVSPPKLKAEVQNFYRLCSGSGSSIDDLTSIGEDLYKRLLAPIEAKLGPRQVVLIEPDEWLSAIPWAALVGPDGKYFGEMRDFAITPGLFYQSLGTSWKRGRLDEHVVIAAPQTVSFRGNVLAPLPQAEEEADEIAGLFPGSVYLKGPDADVGRLLKHLPQASIFHFAGHALGLDHGGELVLAGMRSWNVVSASELSGIRLRHCRLVVLSACSTATAEQDITRDPDGLVSAFLASGAENVVASRWDVDSTAAAELMRYFYRSTQAGSQAAGAIREARGRVRSLPTMRSPYYWAAFELFAIID